MPDSGPPPEKSTKRNERELGPAILVRLFVLHQRLCRGEKVTAIDLARELEVDERTIRRDLETMANDLGAPVERDASARTYFYTHTCDFLPMVKFSPAQAFAVAVALHAFAAAEGASAELVSALGALTPLIGGIVSFPLNELGTVVSAPTTDGAFRFAELLVHAAIHRRELRVTYLRLTPGAEPKEHRLEPLHLAPLDHQWTLIARVSGQATIKHFLFSRMQEVAATGMTFERPADFDAAQHLAGSIGRFAGNQDIEVRLAFAPKLAGYAWEEFRRHPSARRTARPDGRTEITLRVNNYADIKNAAMRYGDHVEVLAPPQLREKVRHALATALAQYG
jgi:predicted DNA-binding transcriptional regulator YafY